MCTFNRTPTESSFVAYKIVIKIGDEYFSPATGMKYPMDNKPIPIIKERKILVDYFANVMDENSPAYNPCMVGRTSAFLSLEAAQLEKEEMEKSIKDTTYKLRILKVRISNDLLEGTYGSFYIVAGRVMETIGEIKVYKKFITDCTQCPNFNEETEWEDTYRDCAGIVKLEFYCGDRKIRDAEKNEKGQWDNSYCKIPDWCPLEDAK